MPNWCDNTVNISGMINNEKLFKYLKELESSLSQDNDDYKFNNFIVPISKEEWSLPEAIELWGTKWEIDLMHFECDIDEDQFYIYISYMTAWSPNINVTKALMDKIEELNEGLPDFDLSHTYSETGAGFTEDLMDFIMHHTT